MCIWYNFVECITDCVQKQKQRQCIWKKSYTKYSISEYELPTVMRIAILMFPTNAKEIV